ncbi:MFS transporter [Myxococcaceae bacterium GXIMD 01537]
MTPPPAARRAALAGFYFLLFAVVGITLPFLPAYLKSRGLSATEVGTLLAITPLLSLAAPPLWGLLADRTGRPGAVLTVLSVGALAGLAPMLWVEGFAALAACLAVLACFSGSFTPVVDSLALEHIQREGGSFARLRLFGSLGFVLSSTAFGLFVPRVDGWTLLVPMGLYFLLAAWSFRLHARAAPGPRVNPLSALRLLRHPDLRWLLAATSLHWLACAPYHGTFSFHVLALGLSPAVVGLAAGLGVLAEVVVMYLYPRVAEHIAPRHVLCAAFAATAVRWLGLSLVSSGPAMVALALLHGMSFGAFYVASVAFMARRVPAHLRASGQGLFAAVTFGVGGLVGYVAAGAGYDWLGGHRLYVVAAVLEVIAAVLVLRASPPPQTEPLLGEAA